jgi:hypothetical protein
VDTLYKLEFNFRFGFGKILKPLNDVHIPINGDNGWVRLCIALPPLWRHEYKLENLQKHYHFKAQTMISIYQGIEEIGRDGDLDFYVTMTLPSPCSTPLKTPFGSCRHP